MSIITINIDGRNIGMSYSQADALMNDIRNKMFQCDEHFEEMKLVKKRLKEFEESNRQFPDELFIPASERDYNIYMLIDNHLGIWLNEEGSIMKEGTIVRDDLVINGHSMDYWIEGQEKYWKQI